MKVRKFLLCFSRFLFLRHEVYIKQAKSTMKNDFFVMIHDVKKYVVYAGVDVLFS